MSISFNMCIQEGMGALHLAAAKGHDEIVQELLDAGVAPDMQDKVMELHNLRKSLGHFFIYSSVMSQWWLRMDTCMVFGFLFIQFCSL